jgi:hypothetical protein
MGETGMLQGFGAPLSYNLYWVKYFPGGNRIHPYQMARKGGNPITPAPGVYQLTGFGGNQLTSRNWPRQGQ